MRVVFRCDAGSLPEIGTGHVVRSLCLARGMVDSGLCESSQVVFATRLNGDFRFGYNQIVDAGFSVISTYDHELQPNSRTESDALSASGADLIVLDRLDTDVDLVRRISGDGTSVVTFDDCGTGRVHADLAINALIPGVPDHPNLHRGFEFLVLPPGIPVHPSRKTKGSLRVFVAFGGFDARNLTGMLVESLSLLDMDCEIDIVIGEIAGSAVDSVRMSTMHDTRVRVHERPRNFDGLLAAADIAVVAGGLTALQCAKAGLPAIGIPQYEHQLATVRRLQQGGAAMLAGAGMSVSSDVLAQSLTDLLSSGELRQRMSVAGQRMVDGRGLERVLSLIGPLLDPDSRNDGRGRPKVRIKSGRNTGSAPAQILTWDTEFFGFRVALVTECQLTEASATDALRFCRNSQVRVLEFCCSSRDRLSILQAESHKFSLVDVRMTFERDLAREVHPPELPEGFSFRLAKDHDATSISAIADGLYLHSRYYFDGGFPVERIHEFYRDWARKAVYGEFDDLALVLCKDNAAIGFCTVKFETRNIVRIGLVGLAPKYSGAQLGSALMQHSLKYLQQHDIQRVLVTTQGRNREAQRLYGRAGFLIWDTELWYHRWFDWDDPKLAP